MNHRLDEVGSKGRNKTRDSYKSNIVFVIKKVIFVCGHMKSKYMGQNMIHISFKPGTYVAQIGAKYKCAKHITSIHNLSNHC